MELDRQAIDQLRELDRTSGGTLLRELVELFATRTPPRLQRIRDSVLRGDAAGLEREGHALKSSAGAIGARALSELCAVLEAAGREARLDGAAVQLGRLEELCRGTLAALHAELAR